MRYFILYIFTALSLNAKVVINEIMYNPSGDDDFEWIELYNTESDSIPLAGWKLSEGIKFSFTDEHSIRANDYIVLARKPAIFSNAYPKVKCSGDYKGKLSNNGERIILENSSGAVVDEVEYGVDANWPRAAFNGGASLERIDYASPAVSPAFWRSSDFSSSWYYIEEKVKVRRPEIKIKTTYPGKFIIDDIKITEITNDVNLFPAGDFETEMPVMKFSRSYLTGIIEKAHGGAKALEVQSTKRVGCIRFFLPNVFEKKSRYKISFWLKPLSEIQEVKMSVPGNRVKIIKLKYEKKYGGTPAAENTNPIKENMAAVFCLKHTPFFPKPGEMVNVVAEINEVDTNSIVKLFYKRGMTGEYLGVNMLVSETNSALFSIELPALGNNEYYDYFLQTSDGARFPTENDYPNCRRCYSLEIDDEPTIPIVAFWTTERKPNRRYHVARYKYRECVVAYDGKTFFDARVRYRGNCTYRYSRNKKSYNIKFSKSMRPDIFGIAQKEIALNGLALDNSCMREVMSLELFRRAGLPASRTKFIRLYKNGLYNGLYIFMEKVNEEFLEDFGLNNNAAIMKPDKRRGLNPKGCKAVYEADYIDGFFNLSELYKGLSRLPPREVEKLTRRKNFILTNIFLESFWKYLAVNVIIQKSAANVANYYAYYDADMKKWQLFPWDHDLTWGLLWAWQANRTYINTQSKDIHIFYGDRSHPHSHYRDFSKLVDAMFWPETGDGSEVNQDFRIKHINTITNIISEQLTSGKLDDFVNACVTSIQYEAEKDLNWRFRRNGKQRFAGAINNLKAQMKYREDFLTQKCKEYLEN